MCPPLSCCHSRSNSWLSTQFCLLVRLLLACGSAEELLPGQRSGLEARMDLLWGRLHAAVQHTYAVPTVRALDLTEHLLAAILREECCCEALRQRVSLAEALGQVVPSAQAACHTFLGAQLRGLEAR